MKELLNSSKVSVFYIDEAQKATMKDIGNIELIKNFAEQLEVKVFEGELAFQFRCDGSDSYIAWSMMSSKFVK